MRLFLEMYGSFVCRCRAVSGDIALFVERHRAVLGTCRALSGDKRASLRKCRALLWRNIGLFWGDVGLCHALLSLALATNLIA